MLGYCDMLVGSWCGAKLDQMKGVSDPGRSATLNKAGPLSRNGYDSWHIDSKCVLAFWRSITAAGVMSL
jgi:hypothetical protein